MSQSYTNKNQKVLFLGREGCQYTEKALQYLKDSKFKVNMVLSSQRNQKIPKIIKEWKGDYIFSFRSFYYLNKLILSKASKAAINFHPGPYQYPGSGCINFALYNNDDSYGVTAHIMDNLIDHGQIISYMTFPIDPNDNLDKLLKKTHKQLFKLFKLFIDDIKTYGIDIIKKKITETNKAKIKWLGKAKKLSDLNRLQVIDENATKEEIERVIRATYTKKYPPMIKLHGHKFFYRKTEDNE